MLVSLVKIRPATASEDLPETCEELTEREVQVGLRGQHSSEMRAACEAKRTNAIEAMSHVADGSTIALGLAPCHPRALLDALAERGKAKNIRDVKVYYSVSGRHLRNTILRFEQLRRFEPHCLFFGATERELSFRGRAEGRGRVVHYVPNFFYQLDGAVAEHTAVDTFITTVAPMDEEGYFSLGTNSDYSFLLFAKIPTNHRGSKSVYAARARSGADPCFGG